MNKFTGGLVGGVALGIAIGMGVALTDDKYRHRMTRDSRRAMRKANNIMHELRDIF
jgi:hypothetical protein